MFARDHRTKPKLRSCIARGALIDWKESMYMQGEAMGVAMCRIGNTSTNTSANKETLHWTGRYSSDGVHHPWHWTAEEPVRDLWRTEKINYCMEAFCLLESLLEGFNTK